MVRVFHQGQGGGNEKSGEGDERLERRDPRRRDRDSG